MQLLQIAHTRPINGECDVTAILRGDKNGEREASASIRIYVTAQEHEDIRWYLEDYLDHDSEPAPTIAARIESQMMSIGMRLFASIFDANAALQSIWAAVRDQLHETRIEFVALDGDDGAIPWELIRCDDDTPPIAVAAASFVRRGVVVL